MNRDRRVSHSIPSLTYLVFLGLLATRAIENGVLLRNALQVGDIHFLEY